MRVATTGSTVTAVTTWSAADRRWLLALHRPRTGSRVAEFYGDMNAAALNAPVVGSAITPDGNGYYMVAAVACSTSARSSRRSATGSR